MRWASIHAPVEAFHLRLIGLTHHTRAAAAAQKVAALAGRAEVQARDVFDLGHLADARAVLPRGAVSVALRDRAAARVLDLDYAAYSSQVIAYLASADRALWGGRETWDALQLRVLGWLEGLDAVP